MNTTLAELLACLDAAGVTLTDEQRAAFGLAVSRRLGGERMYFPKRASRPALNFVTSARVDGARPAAMVREYQVRYGVSRSTGYRWVKR